ncbi:UDP-N-acetylmuramoyl-L-alanine--D-glutamate ligase, partial [bacterium]|nr:UDP-N-acetylmuramoyl-L-alanine--D-glutamate ligase [bacterium]
MKSMPSSVAVLGLGRSGRATVEFLHAARDAGSAIEIVAYDSGTGESLQCLAREYAEVNIRVVLGAQALDADFEMAVASPGIPPSSALMQSARARCTEIIGEIEFAYRNSCSPWLAVTGTNGKTTTTSLVAHLLRFGGVPTECVGNIGDPAIAVVAESGPSTAIVAEVSSFQLALTRTFRPRVAVLLNITPDHIDWHGSLDAYSADKARVFANQGPDDVAVVDIDDSGSARYAELVETSGVKVIRVSRSCLPVGGAGLLDGTLVLATGADPLILV